MDKIIALSAFVLPLLWGIWQMLFPPMTDAWFVSMIGGTVICVVLFGVSGGAGDRRTN